MEVNEDGKFNFSTIEGDSSLLDLVAKKSNKQHADQSKVVFRNYKPFMDEPEAEERARDDHQTTSVEEVLKLETMYERKVGKIIKQHI